VYDDDMFVHFPKK